MLLRMFLPYGSNTVCHDSDNWRTHFLSGLLMATILHLIYCSERGGRVSTDKSKPSGPTIRSLLQALAPRITRCPFRRLRA